MEGMLTSEERAEMEGCSDEGRGALGDLPEHCLALILSYLSPREVLRVGCVCRAFRAASNFDSVWESMLPPLYKELLALDPNVDPSQFASKREVFDHLCNLPVVYADKTQGFWLDRDTGGVCLSLAARGIAIIWSSTFEYWDWVHDPHSLFPEVARLKSVCWFEARGAVEWSLPPGTYTLSWRLFLDNLRGWRNAPATFTLLKNDVESVECKCYIDLSREYSRTQVGRSSLPTLREVENGWREYDVGEFKVEDGDGPCSLRFAMLSTDVGSWKSGLCLDGVVVRPTNTIRESLHVTYQQVESGFHTPEFQPEAPGFQFPEVIRRFFTNFSRTWDS